MLTNLKDILGYRLKATDDEIGRVRDFYFDDRQWAVRYLVADTGNWLRGRKVILAPASLGEPDPVEKEIPVSLTTEQIEQSPSIDEDKPVSRQHEKQIAGYFNWPVYWAPIGVPAAGMVPPRVAPRPAEPEIDPAAERESDPHLRSVDEVIGYTVEARDGDVGRVHDAIVDSDWVLRYLVVATSTWLPEVVSGSVLICPEWASDVNWPDGTVHVDLTRKQVQTSPPYDADQGVTRAYEEQLHEHYDCRKYWE